MNVKQLIEALQAQDPEKMVVISGFGQLGFEF